MSRYQKRLTFSLPETWADSLSQLKRAAPPGVTQAELLRLLLRAGLDTAQAGHADMPCSKEEKPLL